MTPTSRYAVSLADLEREVHVPEDRHVTEVAEPPPPPPFSPEDVDRQRLLGVTGAGRLHVR